MRHYLRKWLGIDFLEDRIDAKGEDIGKLLKRVQELEDETNLYSGSTNRQYGLKENVWALIEHLELCPEETFEVIPSIIKEDTERHFKLVPRGTPPPLHKVTRRQNRFPEL